MKKTGVVCGCPSWSPTGECLAHNINWEKVPSGSTRPVKSTDQISSVNDLFLPFHNACDTAYTYPYDDNAGTYGCAPASGAQLGPSYNITFCP